MRALILFISLSACSNATDTVAQDHRSSATSGASDATPGPALARAIEQGEVAAWEVVGDTVYVHNRLCAVSHNPLPVDRLDAFTSVVRYSGPDARFHGKELVFNQCCPMCAEKFAALWQRDPEQILAFHGLGKGAGGT